MTGTRKPKMHEWRSYDPVAATYDRLWAPLFTLPARDLVAMLGLPPGGLALDIGTGTGVAALPALKAMGPEGVVVGLDSPTMALAQLRRPWPAFTVRRHFALKSDLGRLFPWPVRPGQATLNWKGSL